MRLKNQRGDTIIEVLFGIAIFALVAVGSLSIMNQGTATAQRALEISLVRQQIDAQAEAIRYIHDSYVTAYQIKGPALTGTAAVWKAMTDVASGKGASSASEFGKLTASGTCPTSLVGEKPFILDARKAQIAPSSPAMVPVSGSLPPFSQVIYNADSTFNQAYGIWIEAVPSVGDDGPGFVDFHIRACWESPGSTVPVTLGTIVRLYEPKQ